MPTSQADQAPRVTVEQGVCVSRSQLWRLQRAFHQDRGVHAFGPGGVPEYGTSNPFVAHQLLGVVTAFVADMVEAGRVQPSVPVYLVELGGGSGRFAHALLRELDAAGPALGPSAPLIVYVLTDLSRAAVDTWRAHPQLQPWLDSGRLDLACFDATDPEATLELEVGGHTLDAAALSNPVVFIANYFFDALPTDYFRFEDGGVLELGCTMTTSAVPPTDPDAAIQDAQITLAPLPDLAGPTPHYGVPAFDDLLQHYRHKVQRSVLPLPVEGLRLVDRLAALAGGPTLWLCTDKGFVHPHELEGRATPSFERHGSISLDFNFHALLRHLELQHGGRAFTIARTTRWLNTLAVVVGDTDLGLPRTAHGFSEHIERFSPDDYYLTFQQLSRGLGGRGLDEILGVWRLVRWDWTLVGWAYEALCEAIERARPDELEQLRTTVQASWDTCLHVSPDAAMVAGRMGTLMCRAGWLEEGQRLLTIACTMAPDDLSVRCNLSTCLAQLGQFDAALAHLDAGAPADPDTPEGQALAALREQIIQAAQED